jgi:hypothetical protein
MEHLVISYCKSLVEAHAVVARLEEIFPTPIAKLVLHFWAVAHVCPGCCTVLHEEDISVVSASTRVVFCKSCTTKCGNCGRSDFSNFMRHVELYPPHPDNWDIYCKTCSLTKKEDTIV